MALLTRFIKEAGQREPSARVALACELKSATLIRIQNVANYCFTNQRGPFDFQSDCPNIAPPWPLFLMSFKVPPWVGGNASGIEFGYLISAAQDEAADGWRANCMLLRSNSHLSTIRILDWRTNKDGQLLPIDGLPTTDNKARVSVSKEVTWPGELFGNSQLDGSIVAVPFLAISFCHCKNVDIVREPVPPRVKAKRERTQGWSLDAWHTLKIEPMRKQLAEAGAEGTGGLKRALHIMRGHFKDYREGRGLFGKVHGMWWWDFRVTDSGHQHRYDIDPRL